jgi:hypothetical protein
MGLSYEDFDVGAIVDVGEHTFTAEEIIEFGE